MPVGVATQAETQRQLARLEIRTSLAVRVALSGAAQKIAQVVANNPDGDITAILARYDIAHALQDALASARETAEMGVERAWRVAGQEGVSAYRDALLADVARAYDEALAEITAAVQAAYAAVPPAQFVPGQTEPGTNPAMEAAAERARGVRQAVIAAAARLALRNRLTVGAAGAAGSTEATLAQAEQMASAGVEVRVVWRTSHQPPDASTCPWCRSLNGTAVTPGQQFAHPVQLGKRKPPKLYRGTLFGPQLHPNCRCYLAIVAGPFEQVAAPTPAEQQQAFGMISSEDIRDMPEERYSKLISFLRSALHELGQMLRRLVTSG